eukprot:7137068-Lingulodinium_polyedra.AAC.1
MRCDRLLTTSLSVPEAWSQRNRPWVLPVGMHCGRSWPAGTGDGRPSYWRGRNFQESTSGA